MTYTIKYIHSKNRALSTELDFDAESDLAAADLARIFAPEGYLVSTINQVEKSPTRFKPELCKQLQIWLDGKPATEILKEMEDGTH